MERIAIGIVAADSSTELDLAAAAMRHDDIKVHRIDPDAPPDGTLSAIIVDVPLKERGTVIDLVANRWQLPILVETPLADTLDHASALVAGLNGVELFSMNPLRHSLPTRRLVEGLAQTDDPLQTLFAVWRFRAGDHWEHALPQLIDYISWICGSPLDRIAAMRRDQPPAMLVSLCYANGVVGSLEIGAHMPDGFPTRSTLLIECFCTDSVHHCTPDSQAITILGSRCERHGWLPDPARDIISTFVDTLRTGQPPMRGQLDDLHLLAVCQAIHRAAFGGDVWQWDDTGTVARVVENR